MARQRSIIKLEGNIGDINFYRSKDGYLARERSRLTAERIASDPKFKRTRENNAEFTKAAEAGRVMRNAFGALLQNSKDPSSSNRLFTEMLKVVKADLTSERGQRNVIDGETELLQGFEFNSNATLKTTLFADYSPEIDRVAGTLATSIPSFVPEEKLLAPVNSTHFRIVSLGSEINFADETYSSEMQETAILPWGIAPTAVINMVNHVTPNSTLPLFLLLGLQFFQEVNGHMYPLKDGGFNSLSIIKVSGV